MGLQELMQINITQKEILRTTIVESISSNPKLAIALIECEQDYSAIYDKVSKLSGITTVVSSVKPKKSYKVEGDRLVEHSVARNGNTYDHVAVDQHVTIVINKLRIMAKNKKTFYTKEVIDRGEMPVHEPRIVLNWIRSLGYLERVKKGQWKFLNVEKFLEARFSF